VLVVLEYIADPFRRLADHAALLLHPLGGAKRLSKAVIITSNADVAEPSRLLAAIAALNGDDFVTYVKVDAHMSGGLGVLLFFVAPTLDVNKQGVRKHFSTRGQTVLGKFWNPKPQLKFTTVNEKETV
jgi:hypothetical protein